MNYSSVSLRKPLALLGVGLSLFAAQAAFAQTPTTTDKKDETLNLEKFTVTGSYLPLTSEVSASPVVIIERSKVGLSGATDALRLLKTLTPFFSGNGNVGQELNNGGNGSTNVALRNLTTLVLLNGRRTSGDLSNIPVAMIERVEILKDSASTIYGSDAIGGVVNFILRKDYNGFEFGARQIATRNNDYQAKEAWVAGGVTFPGGSITVGAAYFENTQLGTNSRKLTILSIEELNALGGNPSNPPNYFSGSFPGRVSNSVLAGSPVLIGKPGYNAALVTPPGKATPLDAPQTLAQLTAAGIYVPILASAGGSFTTTSLLNTALFNNALIVPTRREIYTMSGEKELFGKNLKVFSDFYYADTLNGGVVLAPAPLANLTSNTLTIPANNPYNLFGRTLGVGQTAGAPNPRQRLIELGKRSVDFQNFVTRVVIGFRGEINDKYSWETAFSYRKEVQSNLTNGGGLASIMNQAMIPLLDSTGTAYVKDAQGRYLSTLTDSLGNNLPIYNYFALPGFNDPRTLAAIKTDLFTTAFADARIVDFRLTGAPFELPAGDFRFVVGGEARRERLANHADSNFTTGGALGFNPITGFPGGQRSTRSVFLETSIPLVNSKMSIPLVNTLDLTAAFRFERLTPGGDAKTPKFGLLWKPVDNQFLLRATVSKGFIAPSISALFGPPGGNSPTVSVPLSAAGGTGPGGAAVPTVFVSGQFVGTIETSNPKLEASKSTSYTGGFVYAPKGLKGFSMSVDYYHIKQDKIGGFDYNAIVADINAKGVGSKYAAGLVFNDGSRVTTATAGQITSTNVSSLTLATDPSGDQFTSGVDVDVDYKMDTAAAGFFDFGIRANMLGDYKARATPSTPYAQYARNFTDGANGLGNANGNLAGYVLKPYLNWAYKDVKVSLNSTYLPAVVAQGTLFGGAQPTNNQRADGKAYIIPSYHTEDVSFSYTVPNFGRSWMKGINLTAGVINVFDKKEIYVPGGGSGSSESNSNKTTYDIIGRQVFFELKKVF